MTRGGKKTVKTPCVSYARGLMESDFLNAPVTIPNNYTDAGKIFGFFEIRNVVETAAAGIPLIILIMAVSPFGLTWTIIGGAVVVVPACGFALIGVHDYSLITFLRLYFTWRKGSCGHINITAY